MSKIQNEDVKTLAQLTGAGGSADQLINDTKIYVTASGINKQLSQAIIDGNIGGGGSYTVYDSTAQNISASGTITQNNTNYRQIRQVQGASSTPVTTSTTPFGTGSFLDGMEILIVGRGATVSIPYNDAANGAIGNFESLDISQGEFGKFVYLSSISRFIASKGAL